MLDPDWNDDEKLIAALRAALTDSSAQEPLDALAIRSESAILRSVTFASDSWTVEVELTPDAVRGQLDPAEGGTVTARGHHGALVSADVDELGCFVLGPPPAVPYRLACVTRSGTTILTGWITP